MEKYWKIIYLLEKYDLQRPLSSSLCTGRELTTAFEWWKSWNVSFNLINYSWRQQPINLAHMHEPWYPMNTQMKILWVLIWDQTLAF